MGYILSTNIISNFIIIITPLLQINTLILL